MSRQLPKVIESHTEERNGQVYVVNVLQPQRYGSSQPTAPKARPKKGHRRGRR